MHDALYNGRQFYTLNVLDDGNRESLAIAVGTSIQAARVVRVLDQLVALRLDNGPELTVEVFVDWCDRTDREEVLDAFLWVSTQEVQQLSDAWRVTSNEHRPHDTQGRVPPLTYLARITTRSESNHAWSTLG